MKGEWLRAHFDMPLVPCLSLVMFALVFAGAVYWVYRRGSRKFYEELGQLPLD